MLNFFVWICFFKIIPLAWNYQHDSYFTLAEQPTTSTTDSIMTSSSIMAPENNNNNETFICFENKTLKISTENIVFFESPKFPNFLNNNNICSLKFEIESSENNLKNKKRGILVITNPITSGDCSLKEKFQVFNNINSSFSFLNYCFDENNYIRTIYNAFQGFALFDDWGQDESCPLESISRVNPFNFTDETQIIYLQSTFYPNSTRKHPCLWQFSAPEGYGFKFIIQELNILFPVQLTIENGSVILETERSARTNYPYYNNDNYLKISLSNHNLATILKNLEFSILISIFKINWKPIIADCKIIKTLQSTIWSLNDGYPNNAKCIYELILEPHSEAYVTASINIEPFGDVINYYGKNNGINETLFSSENDQNLRFFSNKDGTSNKHIKFEFISDTNIQSFGFELNFEKKICKCGNPIIFLNCFSGDNIMGDNDERRPYCANLRCNYTLKLDANCSKEFINLRINIENMNSYFVDIYRIISNNAIVYEINRNSPKWISANLVLPVLYENIFEKITNESPTIPNVFISAWGIRDPEISKNGIKLTKENPLFSMDIDLIAYKIFILETDDPQDVMEIYINNDLNGLIFYENESLIHPLNFENCFIPNTKYAYNCKIPRQSVAVLSSWGEPFSPYILTLSQNHFKNYCIFKENVFVFENNDGKQNISAISKLTGVCEIFILQSNMEINLIQSLWTNAINHQTVKVYVGVDDKKKLFFEFNATSASKWKNILLTSRIYTFQIPPNSSLIIHLINETYNTINFDKFNYPYQSMLSTLDYGIETQKCDQLFNSLFLNVLFNFQNLNDCYSIKFMVVDYNLTSGFDTYFCNNNVKNSTENNCEKNDRINITHINQEFIFSNPNATILFHYSFLDVENLLCSDYSGILLFMEVVVDNFLEENVLKNFSNKKILNSEMKGWKIPLIA